MLVVSHKREVDGPAPIPLDFNMVHQLEIIITKLRPLVSKDGSDSGKIFLKTDGAPFQWPSTARSLPLYPKQVYVLTGQ